MAELVNVLLLHLLGGSTTRGAGGKHTMEAGDVPTENEAKTSAKEAGAVEGEEDGRVVTASKSKRTLRDGERSGEEHRETAC